MEHPVDENNYPLFDGLDGLKQKPMKTAMQELKCLIKDRIKNLNNELNYYTSGYKQGLVEMEIEVDYYIEKEKEQLQKAFSDGQETPINHPTLPHYSRDEYYNDNYNQNK